MVFYITTILQANLLEQALIKVTFIKTWTYMSRWRSVSRMCQSVSLPLLFLLIRIAPASDNAVWWCMNPSLEMESRCSAIEWLPSLPPESRQSYTVDHFYFHL
jgi:hypothetical protein